MPLWSLRFLKVLHLLFISYSSIRIWSKVSTLWGRVAKLSIQFYKMSTMGCVLRSTVTKIKLLSHHQNKDFFGGVIFYFCTVTLTLILQEGSREPYITPKLLTISSHDYKGHILYTFVSGMTSICFREDF